MDVLAVAVRSIVSQFTQRGVKAAATRSFVGICIAINLIFSFVTVINNQVISRCSVRPRPCLNTDRISHNPSSDRLSFQQLVKGVIL